MTNGDAAEATADVAQAPPVDEFHAVVDAAGAPGAAQAPFPKQDEFDETAEGADQALQPPPAAAEADDPNQLNLFPSTQAGYTLPPLSLLRHAPQVTGEEHYLAERASVIERTLQSFNIEAGCVNSVIGPRVTRFELKIGTGINVSRIHGLADNLALELAVKAVRIEAPIPGLSAVGIEVPNASPQRVQCVGWCSTIWSIARRWTRP